jgi:glucokinase
MVINDFEAVAQAIAHLGPGRSRAGGRRAAEPRGVRVVMGPGTGLGTATVVPVGSSGWMVLPGEGGHTNPPLAGPAELALWPRCSPASISRWPKTSCRGPASCAPTGRSPRRAANAAVHDSPAAVCQAALAGDATAAAAFELFFTWLGRMAGDLALIVGASGGVYIAGGIVPKYLATLNRARSGPPSRPRA